MKREQRRFPKKSSRSRRAKSERASKYHAATRLDSKNNRKKRGKYKRKPSEVNKHFNIINNIDL